MKNENKKATDEFACALARDFVMFWAIIFIGGVIAALIDVTF